MKTYTVKEIAKMLSVSPETVRRWIRDKKLKAETPSRKEGSQIKEEDLYAYLASTAKYAGQAALMAEDNPALATFSLIGAGLNGIASAIAAYCLNEKKKNPELSEENFKVILQHGISECKKELKKKKKARDQLDEEIDKYQKQLKTYQTLIKQMEKGKKENTE